MKAFTYRLQRVLDIREAKTSHCEIQLAQSERELSRFRSEQEHCQQQLHIHAEKELATTAPIPARHHVANVAWRNHLAASLENAIRAVTRQIGTVNERREDLKKALIDKKVMESLSKRERHAWLDKFRKLEQGIQDEQAVIAFAKKKQNHGEITSDHRLPPLEINP